MLAVAKGPSSILDPVHGFQLGVGLSYILSIKPGHLLIVDAKKITLTETN